MSAAQDFQHQFFDMLMESQYWPEEVMVAYQRSQLEQLLRHARATVPFYENRLDAVFKRDGSIDWDRWREIPILKRADVAANGDASLLARKPIVGHGPIGRISTSGSTGDPVTVRFTELLALMTNACRWRAHRWAGLDWSKSLLSRLADHPSRPDGFLLGPWGPPWDESASQGRAYHVNRASGMQGPLDLLVELRPAYFAAGPSIMHALADLTERRGIRVNFESLLGYGEAVGEAERDVARRSFEARIVELYSSKEAGAIAHQCFEGGGLHVNAETMLVEIVGDNGDLTAVGSTGRVVVTPFSSSAQPLIRYDQGDRSTTRAIGKL